MRALGPHPTPAPDDALVGLAGAILQLAQVLTRSIEVYWFVPTDDGDLADGGPFFNHSHYAQFMNLSIGAALGLMLVKLQEMFPRTTCSRPARLLQFQFEPHAKGIVGLAVVIVIGLVSVARCRGPASG